MSCENEKGVSPVKVYHTSIFLNSTYRRSLVGAFSSWRAFAEKLGVSYSKAYSDGTILERGTHHNFCLEHPKQIFEVVHDAYRGEAFVGYVEVKSPEKDRRRKRLRRGYGAAEAYVKANKGMVVRPSV